KLILTTISQVATSGVDARKNMIKGDNKGIKLATFMSVVSGFITPNIAIYNAMILIKVIGISDWLISSIRAVIEPKIAANIIYESIPKIRENIPTMINCTVSSLGSTSNPLSISPISNSNTLMMPTIMKILICVNATAMTPHNFASMCVTGDILVIIISMTREVFSVAIS